MFLGMKQVFSQWRIGLTKKNSRADASGALHRECPVQKTSSFLTG
jgi:hypothetical protein